MLNHRVTINVVDRDSHKSRVLKSGVMHVPRRLLRLLFGDFCEVLVLTPGRTVQGIEIHEIKNGGEAHEAV